MRASLRRQGIAATQGPQGTIALQERRQGNGRGHRDLRPPARDDAHCGHPDGAGIRDHRRRQRQACRAEAGAGHQGRHRNRQRAEPGAGQAPALLRRPVREPGRGRRTRRCARDGAREDRDLQGKDRGPQEENQEGPLLPGGRAGCCDNRHGDPVDLRDPAIRKPVQGLRCRPAGIHAVCGQPVPLDAGEGLDAVCSSPAQRFSRSRISTSAPARCASSSTGCHCRYRSSARS